MSLDKNKALRDERISTIPFNPKDLLPFEEMNSPLGSEEASIFDYDEEDKISTPPPPPIPDFQPAMSVLEMIEKRMIVAGMQKVALDESHIHNIEQFIGSDNIHLLVAYNNENLGFCVSHFIPNCAVNHLCYFIKASYVKEITSENFFAVVQYGSIKGGHIESLLRLMLGVYAPIFFENPWPNSIKNDFSLQLHRFLASLTDTRWKMQGKTILYVTTESMKVPEIEASKNKELVRRFETCIIHWARQVKEVLAINDAFEMVENSSVLDEIEFWKNRSADLSGITIQLEKEGVKRVTRILELAKSSYVAPFVKLAGQIMDGSRQAESNLKYLSLLQEPCKDLTQAKPKDIPLLLPKIISIIRIIWVNSDFYNTRERLTGIFKKLSNEIIHCCSTAIDLDRIFDGFVVTGKKTIIESIDCCDQWKNIYDKTAKLHQRFSNLMWALDHSSIFAQVEAFVQRCNDMLEVCTADTHFGRQEDGFQSEMPQFSGHRSMEIVCEITEIKSQFDKAHYQLSNNIKSIFDVKDTSWHETFSKFTASMRDLEVMMQNTISSAFLTITTVQGGVELLDTFVHLSSRELIRIIISKMTTSICNLFIEELNAVKKEMSNKDVYLTPSLPKYAGSAHFARLLKNRVQKLMSILERAHFLPRLVMRDDVRSQYKALLIAFDEYTQKTYQEWTTACVKEPLKLLDIPLMNRRYEKPPKIDLNFNGNLLKMMQESYYWERLGFDLPTYCSELYMRRDFLYIRMQNVLLVVRSYNRITSELSLDEHGLFKERIRTLDKSIFPGLTKLTWNAKDIAENFLSECGILCNNVQGLVNSHKTANHNISLKCEEISELLLVNIDPKVVYQNMQFDIEQAKHRDKITTIIKEIHENILATLLQSYEVYKSDGPEVQAHWYLYTEKMDAMLEEALRLNIKWSLQELLKAITGDGKSAPNPFFKVKVVLEDDKIEFSPTLVQLANIVGDIGKVHLVTAIAGIKRLPDLLTKKKTSKLAIYENINNDDEIKKIKGLIYSGMQTNALSLQNYLTTWDNYREIWEINKDAFIGRYQKLNPQNSSFDADIARYNEVANSVQMQETILNIQFVLLDCSSLKSSILSHCHEWQNKFTTLLSKMAINSLQELTNYMAVNSVKVSQVPDTLDKLIESLQLWEKLEEDLQVIEERFAPLKEQFAILEKYEVEIPLEIKKNMNDLPVEWEHFLSALTLSDAMLKRYKEIFKADYLQQATELKRHIADVIKEFETRGPFTSKFDTEEAFKIIASFQKRLESLKEQELEIRRGLNFFKIDHLSSKDLILWEKDLENIKNVWELNKEWMTNWNIWKDRPFTELRTSYMEETVVSLFKNLSRLSRSLKEKMWEIFDTTKYKVEEMKKTLPLINDLNSLALRPRHWCQIQDEMNRSFDHESVDFILEKIIDFGFVNYADFITEVVHAASKELVIEQTLAAITTVWEHAELDIIPFKDRGSYKLSTTENIFHMLDDNQLQLTTMKVSKYVKAFEKEVDHWEKNLSLIMEVVEMLLMIQKHWMHMENIFLGEDIRKQMPEETAKFDYINISWKEIMVRLNADKNALRGTHYPGTFDQLTFMHKQMDEIRRSLDLFLETKRHIFPRFYFLSNDDLLEILGQSRNPESMQQHLKKCFDNMKSLKLAKVGVYQKWEASGMYSCDGEFVEFGHPILLDSPVEAWLCDLEKTMRLVLKDILRHCRAALKKSTNKRDKWLKDWPGQLCILASQIQWTQDVTKTMVLANERNDMKVMKTMKKKQILMLNKYSETICSNLSKIQRLKIVALVIIEVHARDVLEKFLKAGVNDINSFDWLSQLRFYWEKDYEDCIIKQANAYYMYGYEYLGNSGRLVITPLTERCYITLITALDVNKGCFVKGPASTGKTETIKDFGKALALYVIIVNCSEGLDYRSMGRFFAGLAQTGVWSSFDELNRINIEVLSVISQQILSIQSALAANLTRFVFEGQNISLVSSCGIFCTMNQGYVGRKELPDNLKSLFRPCSMVVPDSSLIAEIFLFAEGFNNTKVLAKKVCVIFSLASQQLSKHDHYDFELRAMSTMLRYAGRKKRFNPNLSDEELLFMAIKDLTMSALVPSDIPVFSGIISDMFPDVDMSSTDHFKLKSAIEEEVREKKLQFTENILTKVLQLLEAKISRHSVMLVGLTLTAKTVIWRLLQSSMIRLNKSGDTSYPIIKEYPLNPKALSIVELYGAFDDGNIQWEDGIVSSLLRQVCIDEKPDEKWIIFDGPVDTNWVECLNSLMDDNRVLTLINGERISLSDNVSLLFEVEDLSMASPATVSRANMVHCDYKDLGFMSYLESWLSKKSYKMLVEDLRKCTEMYLVKLLDFKAANCKEPVPIVELNGIISLCKLFDVLATVENGVELTESGYSPNMVQMWFQFSLIWSICCAVDEDGRKKIDNCIREMVGTIPTKDTVYEYYVDVRNKTWVHWEEKLKAGWRYSPSIPFYKLNVPTVDTARYGFLCTTLIRSFHPVLIVGPVGTGKTLILESTITNLNTLNYTVLTINMSAKTSTNQIQNLIGTRVEKHTKGVYLPFGGKKLITFMDDLNMPSKDSFGYQPPLELLKMWLDYGFWFDLEKKCPKYIKDMLLVSAMSHPGGGRMVISQRLQSQFNLINMTFPLDSQVQRIFGSMINQKLQGFEEEIKTLGDVMTQATIEMYKSVAQRFLPTPSRIHYLFNLRDISRVFQGLLRANKNHHDSKNAMTRLWMHECARVFSDRLIDQKDVQYFMDILAEKLGVVFGQTFNNLCPNRVLPLFGDFMNSEKIYEQIATIDELKTFMNHQLLKYNSTPKVASMDLVLFKDAVEHISRIVRVIRQSHGHMLLIGISGSGRRSLTRLASFLCGYIMFQIEVSENYGKTEFREDLKKLYFKAGVKNIPTVFLFSDVQAVDKSFFQDVNCILSSGEVDDLYKGEEFEEVKEVLSHEILKLEIDNDNQKILSFLIGRVRANLHVVLCMSPVGDEFRTSIRMFPAVVNYTTIDWFNEWPPDALLEVADKYISGIVLGKTESDQRQFHLQSQKPALAQMFMITHKSVAEHSVKMMMEMKRYNCVSSTNYLELVTGYKKLLLEKATELTDERDKLKNGLGKIDETREKVEKMSIDLEDAKIKVTAFQKQCDEFLKTLIQQKREADEQQKSVAIKSERIKEEEIKCQALADVAQADLNEAMPALDEANKALESLNKRDMTEIKSYGRPPVLVEKVMESVMILRGNEPTWPESKKQLGDQNFLKQLMNYDKDNITDRILRKIGGYVAQSDFHPDIIGNVSAAARSLCMWVRAMEMYGRIYRVVEPKRIRLNAALAILRDKQEALAEAKAKLAEVEAKLIELKLLYEEKLEHKEELKRKAEQTEMMLDRAQKLMSGLSSERIRWEEKVRGLEESMGHLIGDVLFAAAYLCYMGPFLSMFRDELVALWTKEVIKLGIPCAENFNFCIFMAKPTQVRDWNIQGLPRDEFSTENGIIVTRTQRWPLMVDPQGQAIKWIRNMESQNGLKMINIKKPKYMHEIEYAIQIGFPVMLTDILDKLDPSLDPILNKSLIAIGGTNFMKFGDREIQHNDDFRFYMTTKLSNPLYTPEILTKVNIVNFAVMDKGLEAQLLGIVVRKERPELEEQKDSLVCSIAAGKKKLIQCEEEILRLLNETKGSILDDAQLVDTLQLSKTTSQEVTESVAVSEQMEIKIDIARECYRPCAEQSSILFFILNDMAHIDPMYQFSLDSYITLFLVSIEKSQRAIKLEERIINLNEYHMYAVYKFVCRGLFEKHKLIFSFQMCVKLLEHAKKLNMDEYNFFLRGGIVTDKENQMDNPCTSWLSDESWDNITELDKLTNFHGIITSFEQYSRDWFMWYTSPEPETISLPGEWDKACNELQFMLLVRSLRPDRVSFCATTFIINNLGSKFTEPPSLDMLAIIEDSITQMPLIFILSPGTDPRNSLYQLAEMYGMSSRFHALSLGQGQAPIAAKLIRNGVTEGKWIFLANCHLSISWMPTLSQIVEQLQVELPHPSFRLWLSSSPHPDFPISVLQASVKLTTENPKGLKAGMKRLYNLITEQQFQKCHKPERYRKLLFALCFFHTVLLERRKFRMLGWNSVYEFNDTDIEVSENLLSLYLDGYEDTQWDALRYLIANVNYGGHVTDDWDRRLLMTYINDYLSEPVLTVPFYKLSSMPSYYIPKDGPLSSYKEYVTMLPNNDLPEVFGQHPNAEISSQIQETHLLFDTLLSLQPIISGFGGDITEEKVLELVANIFKQLPENIDYDGTAKILSEDPSLINNVLLQEIRRYNTLLDQIRESLTSVEKGIQGLIIMTPDLELIFTCIFDGRVPPLWEKAYSSLKPLAAWTKDLVQRIDMFAKWATSARPPWVYWLSAFIFPTGFLTAVLQVAARQHQMPVNMFTWEFIVQTVDDSNLTGAAKDGVYIKGMFLQGAGWDKKNAVLVEANSMQLFCVMPTIQFKPVENKKKDIYTAPCYYYPDRVGSIARPSFIIAVDLKSGEKPSDHWVKRGTALLLSLDY